MQVWVRNQLFPSLIVCLVFFFFSQIYFYTFEVLQAAGFDEKMVSYMTLSIGLSELVAAVVCVSHITVRGVGHTLLSSTDTAVISVL